MFSVFIKWVGSNFRTLGLKLIDYKLILKLFCQQLQLYCSMNCTKELIPIKLLDWLCFFVILWEQESILGFPRNFVWKVVQHHVVAFRGEGGETTLISSKSREAVKKYNFSVFWVPFQMYWGYKEGGPFRRSPHPFGCLWKNEKLNVLSKPTFLFYTKEALLLKLVWHLWFQIDKKQAWCESMKMYPHPWPLAFPSDV